MRVPNVVPSPAMPLQVENIRDGETIHQRCLLLKGQCSPNNGPEDFISITTVDTFGTSTFPEQTWPTSEGRFKALLLLSPGDNVITVQRYLSGKQEASLKLKISYVPLLQFPPLHLAIMVAKDSPLFIDCPPQKAISSAHSDLNAAIAKFRQTAYMWQALTAEDLRCKGLGRRSFRLEEEWGLDTLSKEFINAAHESMLYTDSNSAMRTTAKIHVIRSEKTVAELRDAQVAQQNQHAQRKNDLFDFFLAALKAHGGPFTSSAHPVVAGLILDSHYSPQQDLILAHAALGCHNPSNISLGMFGSHLTWSWPRFMEEVSATLLDTTPPGDLVGNDNGECGTAWEACSIGQGAFLHEVGHAFGCPHTTGIMARGYAQDWPKNFLSRTAKGVHADAEGGPVVDGETKNEAKWDLRDALNFSVLPHFRLPLDPLLPPEAITAVPAIEITQDGEDQLVLKISCTGGIARIQFQDKAEAFPSIEAPIDLFTYPVDELEKRFDRTEEVKLVVLGMNGKERTVGNIWTLFSRLSFVRVPGSSLILRKKSVISQTLENDQTGRKYWEWAALFKKRGVGAKITRVNAFDMRVGCILDGGVLYYEDGQKVHLGPRWDGQGREHSFGGHASQTLRIRDDAKIVKVEVNRNGWDELGGLRTHLSNGIVCGELNASPSSSSVSTLEPAPGERIIGFFGRSDWCRNFDGIQEFGIITAPKDAEIPEVVYDMLELQNTDGGVGAKPHWNSRKRFHEDDNDNSDEDMD